MMKKKTIAVGPGLTLDWIRKRNGIMKAIDEQLLMSLEKPGIGLTLDQLQKVVEHREVFDKKVVEKVLTLHELVWAISKDLLRPKPQGRWGWIYRTAPGVQKE